MKAANEAWIHAQESEVLRFITAGSVDDGKSTLIGRLLLDSQGVFADQLEAINRSKYRRAAENELDLALLTDGLEAEREQGITIDVAYRYFATPQRKFIVADAPGHEQYTRNMLTGASTAQAAIILIDASKAQDGQLLTQTRRHTTLAALLGIRHIIVAINKMDLVNWDETVFNRIQAAYADLAAQVGIEHFYAIPISALQGENIAHASTLTPWYQGEALLPLLEHLPLTDTAESEQVRLFVQWVIRHDGHAAEAFRGYAGQLESGHLQVGDRIRVWPSQQEAQIRALYRADQPVEQVQAGDPITIVLDKELDISRGDLLTLANNTVTTTREFDAELCWLDEQALSLPRTYWLKQGSRLTQAKIRTIHQVRDIQTLQPNATSSDLRMNDIASVRVQCRDPLVIENYAEQPITGSFILIDSATNQTAAAGLVQQIG